MQQSTLSSLEKLFLALSDKTRLKLVGLMADGEIPVGVLVQELGESQPKVSRHLAYLRSMGVVSTRRDGKWIYYGIASQKHQAIAGILNATIMAIDHREYASPTNLAAVAKPTLKAENPNHEEISQTSERIDEMDVFLL